MALTTSQLRETLIPVEDLGSRYDLTSSDFQGLLLILEDPLKLEPEKIHGIAYLTPLQVGLLDSLKPLLKDPNALSKFLLDLEDGALLYRCSACGELKLTKELLLGNQLLHSCDLLRLKTRLSTVYDFSSKETAIPLGRFELLASGPLESLVQWTHSVSLKLDDQLKATI